MSNTVASAAAVIEPSLSDADARATHPGIATRAALTAATPAATDYDFIFNTRHLDPGAPLLLHKIRLTVTVTWDPEQISHTEAVEVLHECAADAGIDTTGITLPYTDAITWALAGIDKMRDPDPKVTAFCDYLTECVLHSVDPDTFFEELYELLKGHRELGAFLTAHDITSLKASPGTMDGPLYWRECDGRRFLLTPPGTSPAAALAYVTDAFTAREQAATAEQVHG